MSTHNSIMVLLGHLMSEEQIIDQLQEKINEYKEAKLINNTDKCKESIDGIAAISMLLLSKLASQGDPLKLLDEMEKTEQARNIIKPDIG